MERIEIDLYEINKNDRYSFFYKKENEELLGMLFMMMEKIQENFE